MPGQIRITFKNFTSPPDPSQGQKVVIPRQKQNVLGEETLLRETLKGITTISPRRRGTSTFDDLLNVATPPTASMSLAGSIPGTMIRRPLDFTVTFGPSASAGAGTALGASGGIYFWNKKPDGEVGLFGTMSIGVVSNLGFSVGDAVTYLFGPAPTVLAGDAIVVSVDVGIDVATVSGLLVINAPPGTLWPPALTGPWTPEIIGVGFALSVGLSSLPVDVSVMPGRTWIKPF
ncbi:MAG: hypothetical protein WCA27_05240 [Candidatus Sulfotelmatobacter sp.]